MEFKRAITKQQRDIRREEITSEAMRLFLENGYDAVTFHKISKNIGYNRTILYSLYETPADILLEYLAKKIKVIYDKLEEESYDGVGTIYKLVGLIDLDCELKQLAAVFGGVIEPHGSMKFIMYCRRTLRVCREQHWEFVAANEPDISEEVFNKYNKGLYLLYVGTANINPANKRVEEVNKSINMKMSYISFSDFWLRMFGQKFNDPKGHEYLKKVSKQVYKMNCKN